jgi:hypothetical protein
MLESSCRRISLEWSFLKLPELWEEPSNSDPGMMAIKRAFRQSNRIVAVVRVWNEYVEMEGIQGYLFNYRLDVNERSPLYAKDILQLFTYRTFRPAFLWSVARHVLGHPPMRLPNDLRSHIKT